MADEKIDFSALDPALDAPRWEQLIDSVAQRALAERARPNPLLLQLSAWGRPALVLAAGLAIAIWCAALVQGWLRAPATVAAADDPVHALVTWASDDAIPGSIDPAAVLGGTDVE